MESDFQTVFKLSDESAARRGEGEVWTKALVTPQEVETRLRALLGPGAEISGTNSCGTEYHSIESLWDKEFSRSKASPAVIAEPSTEQNDWYQKGYDYWESEENCPLTDDGVLGGFGHLTEVDTRDSAAFLAVLQRDHRPELNFSRAAGQSTPLFPLDLF